jgi:hypothetical protein
MGRQRPPDWTPEVLAAVEKAEDNGYTIMAAKAAAKLEAEQAAG